MPEIMEKAKAKGVELRRSIGLFQCSVDACVAFVAFLDVPVVSFVVLGCWLLGLAAAHLHNTRAEDIVLPIDFVISSKFGEA